MNLQKNENEAILWPEECFLDKCCHGFLDFDFKQSSIFQQNMKKRASGWINRNVVKGDVENVLTTK